MKSAKHILEVSEGLVQALRFTLTVHSDSLHIVKPEIAKTISTPILEGISELDNLAMEMEEKIAHLRSL